MGEVAQFLYGRDDAWPLPGRDFEHSKLTDSLLILNVFTDKRHTAIFPALISGICEAAGVKISPAEPVMKAKGPINRFALENGRRHTARPVGAVPDAQDQPPEQQPAVPQPAAPQPAAPPADMTAML
ncbi:hypothetical protein Adt_14041 [Abeliophyllum distichum]|uniref:Uncharacterized protein n=1 Tax=Abeliophyllum distichum TaxID=126358 RepID=A0ABD1TYI6_9LAMI